jgi:hypothetical protein
MKDCDVHIVCKDNSAVPATDPVLKALLKNQRLTDRIAAGVKLTEEEQGLMDCLIAHLESSPVTSAA